MKKKWLLIPILLLIPVFMLFIDSFRTGIFAMSSFYDSSDQWQYICEHQGDYPDSLVDLALQNKETIPFVYEYPFHKDQKIHINESLKEIPLFLQWDERWGYLYYGNDMMAINGCGPTCLSMVMTFLTKNTQYNPYYISQYSEKNGYHNEAGTSWSLMKEGARHLGLHVKELSLDESIIQRELESHHPIICSMGKGEFTTTGHFIVLTQYENGYVSVHDPNSIERSQKTYVFDDIKYQIKNLWCYSYEE